MPLEWQDAVIRAAITLKLCLFEDTGAIVAAMTTSIPEAPGSERNWDYRYCWLRDAFFVVRALNSLSEVGTMEDYLRWLAQRGRRSRRTATSSRCTASALERELPECDRRRRCAGYRGMGPVRVGNQAQEHFQHDVYGNIVLGAAQAFHDHRLLRPATAQDFARLERVGEQACARLRPARRRHVGAAHARARAHLVGADELGRLRPARADRRHRCACRSATRCGASAPTQIRAAHPDARVGASARQAFAESFGGRDLDASVLLMAEVGFIAGG